MSCLRELIGLSLSFCVRDILNGLVQVEEVVRLISGTTGFVSGENREAIIDTYRQVYWVDFSREEINDVVSQLLPVMEERQHGLPGHWVDARMPHEWGVIPYGCGEGILGTYINTRTNETKVVFLSESRLLAYARKKVLGA